MISIVIPAYNEEKYLPKLLKSLERQTFKDYEIIVADNNSKDNTKKIAKKFKCKLVKGGPPGKARNKGAKVAKHDLLFIDADTVLKDNTLLKKFLERVKKENIDVASCMMLADSEKFPDKLYYHIRNYEAIFSNLFVPHTSGQFLFMKKTLFKKINGYDESLYLGEEHDLVQRAVKSGGNYKLFTNLHVHNNPRRIKHEGWLRLFFKSHYSEIYRLFFGKLRKEIFEYEFGNYD